MAEVWLIWFVESVPFGWLDEQERPTDPQTGETTLGSSFGKRRSSLTTCYLLYTPINQCALPTRRPCSYPDDKYAPSSLLLGFTITGRPLHIQASHVDSDLLKIMTIYEPDPAEWDDFARRR